VPRPDGTLLYIKLRDDPSVISTAALPVLPEQRKFSGIPQCDQASIFLAADRRAAPQRLSLGRANANSLHAAAHGMR